MTELVVASRVKLKPHVYFGLVEDGIVFDAGETSFIIKDRSVYPIVHKLISLIDEGNSVESVLERAPTKIADILRRLLQTLADHEMLLHVDPDAPSAEALAGHDARNELRKFLEDRLSGVALDEALRKWCMARVSLVGGGHSLKTAIRAMAANGIGTIEVFSDAESRSDCEMLRNDLSAEHATRIEISLWESSAEIATPDLMVYAADRVDMSALTRVETLMRESAVSGAIAGVLSGVACVLPPALSGRPGVEDLLCWLDPHDPDSPSHGRLSLSLLGGVAAQLATFRYFDVEPRATRGQVALVSPGLEVEYRMLVPSAHSAQTATPFVHVSKYEMPQDRSLLPFERLKLSLEPWFDPVLGPFAIVADDAIEQVPILQYPLRVKSAMTGGPVQWVVGWGLEHADAVLRGLSAAIECFAATFQVHGMPIAADFDEHRWKRRAWAYAAAASDRFAGTHRWAWMTLDDLRAPELRLLARLLRFHAPDGVRIQLQWMPEGGAVVARTFVDDICIARGISADVEQALQESLGAACSRFQLRNFGRSIFESGPDLPLPAHDNQAADWRDAFVPSEAGPPSDIRYRLLTQFGFPPSIHCGYALLDQGAAPP